MVLFESTKNREWGGKNPCRKLLFLFQLTLSVRSVQTATHSSHNMESGGSVKQFDRTYFACEFRRKYVCDNETYYQILNAYSYYTIVNMLVYPDITNKTYLENDNLVRKYGNVKNLFWDKERTTLITDKRFGGAKPYPLNNLWVGNRS